MKSSRNNRLIPTALISCLVFATTSAFAHETPRGKLAELALHRTERLVILKKISASFQNLAESVSLQTLQPSSPSDPVFKATVKQGESHDGNRRSLDLLMDDDGKTLQFQETNGGEPHSAPSWPSKDPLTLLEVALHCVQGELIEGSKACLDNPLLPAFNQGLTDVTLSAEYSRTGTVTGAVAEIRAEGAPASLKIRLTPEGALNPQNPFESGQ